jgi:hypothetical protein
VAGDPAAYYLGLWNSGAMGFVYRAYQPTASYQIASRLRFCISPLALFGLSYKSKYEVFIFRFFAKAQSCKNPLDAQAI